MITAIGTNPPPPESSNTVRYILCNEIEGAAHWIERITDEIDALKSYDKTPREVFIPDKIWKAIQREFIDSPGTEIFHEVGNPAIHGTPVTVRNDIDYIVVVGVEMRKR